MILFYALGAVRSSNVPIAVKCFSFEMQGLKLGLRHLDPGRIGGTIQFRTDLQTGYGGDQVNNDLVADERTAAPVLSDVAEHTTFDLIPLARARWIVIHVDGHSQTSGQILQCHFPQAATAAVATRPRRP